MKKRLIILLILILILFYPFYSVIINKSLNNLRVVNKDCTVDQDCKMFYTDCFVCHIDSKGQAVNINYKPLCPLGKPFKMTCPEGKPLWETSLKAVCEDNKCTEELLMEEPDLLTKKQLIYPE